jgi:hypothetical protein
MNLWRKMRGTGNCLMAAILNLRVFRVYKRRKIYRRAEWLSAVTSD